jgi:hypothetical protein
MAETFDLLFELFCAKRIGKAWAAESKKLTQWLQSDATIRKRKTAA